MASGDNDSLSSEVGDAGDSCMWYANAACVRPRSCYDCLNVAVVDDNCAIGEEGQCMSVSDVDSGARTYASDTFTYCDDSDAVCSSCRANWLRQYASGTKEIASSVCTGDNDCICLAVCERTTHDSLVLEYECPVLGSGKVVRAMIIVGMAVGVFLVFGVIALVIRALVRHFEFFLAYGERRAPSQSRRRPRSPRGPQLTLEGWKAMREELIAVEKDGGSPKAGPAGVHRVQLIETGGSAPEIIVEEGEGFRPMSPSQLERGHVA